jgi:hypothetical protein
VALRSRLNCDAPRGVQLTLRRTVPAGSITTSLGVRQITTAVPVLGGEVAELATATTTGRVLLAREQLAKESRLQGVLLAILFAINMMEGILLLILFD